jgi:hypothetical protein
MPKSIKEIPFWGILGDCFPELLSDGLLEIIRSEDESLITDDQWWAIARWWRGALLNESDWSQVPDNSLTEEKRLEWRLYRESLRSLTDTYEDPQDIVFPDMPTK